MASAAQENIGTDETGAFLPATQRPDGTWRKPRKVKPGYIPQEEVPLYESKGKQWMNSKPRLPPGVYEEPASVKVEEPKQPLSKAAKKNEKRRQKRKDKQGDDTSAALNQNGDVDQLTGAIQGVGISASGDPALTAGDPQKRIKNLKKKIRQIEELEAKIASGEVAEPSKEQLEKIARKDALQDELNTLEDGS